MTNAMAFQITSLIEHFKLYLHVQAVECNQNTHIKIKIQNANIRSYNNYEY